MKYTVKKLADLAGVSVRTLHYYDEIDLLKPKFVKENGYRFYGEEELLRLQQILFFRELEFELSEVKAILDDVSYDALLAMSEQKKMLQLKRDRLNQLILNISNTINDMKNNKKISGGDMFNGFGDKELEELKREAKERWGHTDAWKQSQEITKTWSNEDFERVQKEGMEILVRIVAMMDMGVEDEQVQKEIALYHGHIGCFYDCSFQMFGSLGEMYSADGRFKKYYENIAEGLAEFMTEAIKFYCEKRK